MNMKTRLFSKLLLILLLSFQFTNATANTGKAVGRRRVKNASMLWFRGGGTEDFFRGVLRSWTVCALDLYRGLGG